MSWLASSAEDRDYVTALADEHPQVYRLALVIAPALRIEPLLLRNARLRFVPRSEAALEARLWFSPLIASRSARAVVLRTGLARALTDRLDRPDAPFSFAEVWAFIERHTAHWSGLDRLEQDLRQAARSGDRARVQDGLRHFLREVEREPEASDRRELARWVKGALPGIAGTDGTGAPVELALAAQFAAASLGDHGGALGRRAREPGLPPWLARQVPPGKGQALGLRLHPGVLECLAPDDGGHRIELGLSAPVPVHIRRDDGVSDPGRWEALQAGRRVPLPQDCRRFVLTTPTGARYRLAAAPATEGSADGKETSRWEATGDLIVAYLPADQEAAERVVRLLLAEGIAASLVPEASAAAATEGRDACLVRLWSQAAADRISTIGGDGVLSAAALVLRMDETPLAEGGASDARVVDLSRWQGEPAAPQTRDLFDAVRSVLKPAGPDQYVHAKSVDFFSAGDAGVLTASMAPIAEELQTGPAPAAPIPIPKPEPFRPPTPRYSAFISYAWVDDQPFDDRALEGSRPIGWVSTFVDRLRKHLGRAFGSAMEGDRIWFDHEQVRGNEPFSVEIRAQLVESRLLVPILSPGWFASAWCREELTTFLTFYPDGMERVFPVWMEPVERANVPPEAQSAWDTLREFLGYKFWYLDQGQRPRTRWFPHPDPADDEYSVLQQDLARQMASRVKTLMRAESPESLADPIDRRGEDIFIAYARKDLSRIEPIARALESLGYVVWWDADLRAGRRFDEEIERVLAAAPCVLVVWTAISVQRQWVRAEAAEALDANKLVPVFLEPVKPPLYFRHLHGVDLGDWDGSLGHGAFQRLVRAIAELAGPGAANQSGKR